MIRFSRRYSSALNKHLASKRRASLRPAESLGREALAVGLLTLDLIGIHERALIPLLFAGSPSSAGDGRAGRASSFLVAALTPIEDAHRTALRRARELSRLNATMRRRTVELAATHRQLECAIGRRKAVQEALVTSEQHCAQLLEKCRRARERARRLSHELLSAKEGERTRIRR